MKHRLHGFVASTNLQLFRFMQAPTCRRYQPRSLLKHPVEMEAPNSCMQASTQNQIGTQYSLSLESTLPDINFVLFGPWPMQHSVSTHSIVAYCHHHNIIFLSTLCLLHNITLFAAFFLCIGIFGLSQSSTGSLSGFPFFY